MQEQKTDAEIATNRFGYGARSGEIARAAVAPRQWLLDQLQPLVFDAGIGNSVQAQELIAEHLRDRRAVRQARRKKSTTETGAQIGPAQRQITALSSAVIHDTLWSAIETDRPFAARLLDFFSNHFSVSYGGLPLRCLTPTLEREAIAPFLDARFEDMLLAVERHPAMLIYLNNELSTGPGSALGLKSGKGLNENLAREILELHTLGVAGGYAQGDVRELAMALSGWSVGNLVKGEPSGFYFRGAAHEPGARRVLGKVYNAADAAQAEAILRDLAHHPATARHLAFKLARHFVADEPAVELVSALSESWLQSGGNLKRVVTTLIQHPASWQPQQRKLKTPREFVISVYRATATAQRSRGAIAALTALGQAPFSAGSPAGFGDVAGSWDGAEALLSRIDWSDEMSSRVRAEPMQLARAALGRQWSPRTAELMGRAESRQQSIAMLLMSPEFQRR